MIVYRSDKSGFMQDVNRGEIDLIIRDNFRKILHRKSTEKERDSWWNSLNFMLNVLNDSDIPSNTGVAIECQIPQTSKRIDFILSGYDHELRENVVIVELKQWKKAELTVKDGIVKTALGKGLHETSHPSYQAWSYAAALNDFSETVQERSINLQPCAFLHNYEEDEVIRHPFYSEYLEKAPVFLKRDQLKLQQFIKKFVRSGDNGAIMFRIDEGRIRPSKQLSESLSSIMKGNKEFILLDEQKLIYETALFLTEQAQFGGKKVYIMKVGLEQENR